MIEELVQKFKEVDTSAYPNFEHYEKPEHSGESDPGFRSYPTPRSVSKRPLH
jgi:hypothetical protein